MSVVSSAHSRSARLQFPKETRGDMLAEPGHQVVDDAVEETWCGHAILSPPAVDREPAGVVSVHAHTAFGSTVELAEHGDKLDRGA